MIRIGAYRENYKDDALPSIYDVMRDEPQAHKEILLTYLKKGKVTALAPGSLRDVVSGETLYHPTCYTDGAYCWRSDLIHYVEKYNVALPDDFVRHVLEQGQRAFWHDDLKKRYRTGRETGKN